MQRCDWLCQNRLMVSDAVAEPPEITKFLGNDGALEAGGPEDCASPYMIGRTTEQRTPEPEIQFGHHLAMRSCLAIAQQGGLSLRHAPLLDVGHHDGFL